MRCSNCGKCCEKTEMELSSEDVKRLAEAGYSPKEFAVVYNGVPQLRNVDGWCYFYDLADKRCRVYEKVEIWPQNLHRRSMEEGFAKNLNRDVNLFSCAI